MGYTEVRPASRHSTPSPSGWRPPLDWSHSYRHVVNPNGFISGTGSASADADGVYAIWVRNQEYPGLPDMSKLEDLAVNKALQNLSDSKTSLGENFAERDQASRMISDRARQVGESVKSYKRSRPKDWLKVKKLKTFGRKAIGSIPNSWLEKQYGWVPLLLDVKGAYDLMRSIDEENDAFRVTAKGARFVEVPIDFWSVPENPVPNPCRTNFHSTGQGRYGVFVRLDYTMENPALHELQQAGLVNPVALAWNLLPYSFVVDWFLPVGDYLSSWTAALGLTFKGGSVSRYQRSEFSVTGTRPTYPQYYTNSYSGGPGKYIALNMSRRILANSPAPRLPHFKNPLSLDHFANAMALLVTAFK